MKRRVLAAALAAPFVAALSAPFIGRAQPAWPQRPLRLVVPFPPGGASDLLGRLMADQLTTRLGQPVVVENRGGAGGLTAAEYVARQQGDGHTLLLSTQATQVFNKYLYANLPYDPDRDFTPLSGVASVAFVLVVNPNVPAQDLPGLIAYARANPGKLNYGSSGIGGGMHLATHLFAERAGGAMVHVPYRGAAPAVTALVQGEVQLMVDLVPNSLPLIRGGQLKAFAVGLLEPTPLLPGVPTFHQYGITDFDVASWFVLVAAGQVPAEPARVLREACAAAVADPAYAARLEAVTARPLALTGPPLQAFLASESARWKPIVASAGVRLD